MKEIVKKFVLWGIVAAVLFSVLNGVGKNHSTSDLEIAYSRFIAMVKDGRVREVTISGETIRGNTGSGELFVTYNPNDPHLVDDLLASGVKINTKAPEKQSTLMQIFISWFPMILLIGVWIYFMRRSQGGGMGGNGAMSFGKSKARLLEPDKIKVTFDDVAGVDEAKDEVSEMVDFLKAPDKFQKLGGHIPTGALMVGPPGTGKTLLARAIAGEAGVPFFTISGSDFVEMFVGVGASRVRDLFEQAKKQSPCIIFIDEIDAVGRQRGAGLGGGHDEREQTLNQLLVELDGFEGNEGVIVIAATNRADVLDKALLRPGRFDRQVTVGLPDLRGRQQILKVHLKQVPMADDIEVKFIAQGTPGFSGADLANLVNEAALFAARNNNKLVDMNALEKAKDKIIMGAERRSMIMGEDEKKLTAYHEAGHCIVGRLVPEHDPVYKVSIMPRGRALGITMFLPESDQYSASRQKLESQISSLYGGRLAEELIFGADRVTTGASNDIERATELARNMVTKWGLSDNLGPLSYGEDEGEIFLGRSVSQTKSVSEGIANKIDDEIRRLIDKNYERAKKLLIDNMDILHAMSDALMKWETIDRGQIDDLMARRTPQPPKDESSEPTNGSSNTPTGKSDKKGSKDYIPMGLPAQRNELD